MAVAHGSRDPRSAATVAALMAQVRHRRPDLDVRVSFLGLSAPALPDALAAVAADGHRSAVVVPLLLGHAFHARVDVPGAVRRAALRHPSLEIHTAGILGDDPDLPEAALHRLAAVAGPLHDPGLGVVLAAIGSSHPPANEAVARIAAGWTRRFGWSGALAAYATTDPAVRHAITTLRDGGARRVAVAQWTLAPGLLPDRIAASVRYAGGDVGLAAPLGACPTVAAAVLRRYRLGASGASGAAVPERAVS